MDLSKSEGDPYNLYTSQNGNDIKRLMEKKDNEFPIYSKYGTYGNNCPSEILDIRRNYFDQSYLSFTTNKFLENDDIRKAVEKNLHNYFINAYDFLDYGGGFFIGGKSKNNAEKNFVILNKYDDCKLETLPFRIEY